ncbi:MAG TPA: NAD(P)/FAD-dependent oxidoreductase [Pirellulales bacterium]|nr:NAD(P)/FAD-dependent oxidoreductase [Pirellulales bacterium]
MESQIPRHRVVIVGGGFGGLFAARSLARAAVNVTLIDSHNHHLFQPLLYQVASGALSPANIAAPLRGLLKRQANARVLWARVNHFDIANRRAILDDGSASYDTLVLAAGSRHSYFGHDEWEAFAPGLKTIDDATAIRRRILEAFELAERCADSSEAEAWLTFVVVGGGPTGVELVGQIAEIAHHTLRGEFRRIDPQSTRIYLVEAADRILPPYESKLSQRAAGDLEKMGVTVLTSSTVTDVDAGGVTITRDQTSQRLASHAVFWAAGVQASPLAKIVARETGAEIDRAGRVHVGPDLTIAGHPEIFVIGDMAHALGADGKPLPALAPVAMQQGRFVARQIAQRALSGAANISNFKPQIEVFKYHDRGTMATIGRGKAVAQFRFGTLAGPIAWFAWLFVHLMTLVQFQNRVLVLTQWAWAYVTRNRSARLITGEQSMPHIHCAVDENPSNPEHAASP